jgi:adenine specific DNA methylase Mod
MTGMNRRGTGRRQAATGQHGQRGRQGPMNHLCYGDNLSVLRDSIRDESVDLTYLDPPFNSNASCNVLFTGPSGNESAAQIEAFDDTWHWTVAAEEEGHA